MTTSTRPDVPRILGGLKDFQRRSVEYVFSRLYGAGATRRFLLADEVGLGKTMVARGVIARTIDHLWDSVERIDIIYICSNAEIARQNINRLNVLQESAISVVTRLTLLSTRVSDLKGRRVNLIPLTPGTSFDLRSSLGIGEERALLFHLLPTNWIRKPVAALNVLQGPKSRKNFRAMARAFAETHQINRAIRREFRLRLNEDRRAARRDGRPSLRRRFWKLCRLFRRSRKHVPVEERREQSAVIGELRAILAAACIESLEPDLIVLDEFQRFKHLLRGEDDAGRLARHLFEWQDTRVLLLSATPYKMYTQAAESDDNHYADFLETLQFLLPTPENVRTCEDLLKRYRGLIYQLADGPCDQLDLVKAELERQLRTVMCRTERLAVTADRSGMLREIPAPPSPLTTADLESYLHLQRISRALESGSAVEYWKSAPYLLNFMDKYDLKEKFTRRLDRFELRECVEAAAGQEAFLLPWQRMQTYEPVTPANPRLRQLIADILDRGLWRLLWLPPTLPYYQLGHPFAGMRDTSKRLVFSSWQVVPKALATLLSYDAERRIVRSHDSEIENTPDARKSRKPLLNFSVSNERLTGMPVLAMLYPSPFLARVVDPLWIGRTLHNGQPATLDRVLDEIEAQLRPGLAAVTAGHEHTAQADEAWYWAAPLLLDKWQAPDTTRAWWGNRELASTWAGGDEEDIADSGWSEHVREARRMVEGRSPNLGRPPADLSRVLAYLALSGPGTAALRALARICGGLSIADDASVRSAAGRIAWSFRSLFNQFEAMAIIRGLNDGKPFWLRVLEYSAAGGLQSVLDEYAHVLRDSLGLVDAEPGQIAEQVAAEMTSAIGLRVAAPRLDSIRATSGGIHLERQISRARFAMRFGQDQAEDSDKEVRSDQVRGAFNSPFWPFVLATTSVGQEGLDFHPYCHAVVHWNLPTNPVDFEQREGRVHRFKGHAVRKNVAERIGLCGGDHGDADVWRGLFAAAGRGQSKRSDLELFWVYPGGAHIERHVPTLALSREWDRLPDLRRSLALYRMVFGQPRQDDLLAYLQGHVSLDRLGAELQRVRIDLSCPTADSSDA